jgi:hypothetical protein
MIVKIINPAVTAATGCVYRLYHLADLATVVRGLISETQNAGQLSLNP